MDTASSSLLARARGGHPLAIATLMQQQLNDNNLDITGWRRNTTIHLELLSFERTDKAQALGIIRQLLSELSPEAVDAVRVSCYLYGEDHPCWIDRVGAPSPVQPQAAAPGNKRGDRPRLFQPGLQRLPFKQGPSNPCKMGGSADFAHLTRLMNAVAAICFGLLLLGGLLWRPSAPLPSFAQQRQNRPTPAETDLSPIRARRDHRP
jgi:hypothetical protein